jgi:isocitrate dehydrogenase
LRHIIIYSERFSNTNSFSSCFFSLQLQDIFLKEGLLERSGNELTHLISDAATMQLIRWTDGGFGMAAHNYDGDMLTDQIAQVHRSPGFITSNLVGKSDDGRLIKEFEASHGTVSDLWNDHLAGKETSLNPLGLVEAMIGAMQHAAMLDVEKHPDDASKLVVKMKVQNFTETLREAMHNTFRYGQGTRDMSGPSGFSTEDFIGKVAWRLNRYLAMQDEEAPPPQLVEPTRKYRRNLNLDTEAVNKMFQKYDKDGDGMIDYTEFEDMMIHLNLAPKVKSEEDEKAPDV